MANILFITQAQIGHYNLMRSTIQLLLKRGNRVAVASVPTLMKEVEKDGAEFFSYEKDYLMERHKTPAAYRKWIADQGSSLSGVVSSIVETFVRDVAEKVRDIYYIKEKFNPDVCVCDIFAPEGNIFAEKYNIPYATICWGIVPYEHKKLPPWGPPGYKMPKNDEEEQELAIARDKKRKETAMIDTAFNEVRKSCGLKESKDLLEHLSPYLTIGPVIEPYGYPLKYYPEYVHYVGAISSDGQYNGWGQFPKEKLDYKKLRVYMSLGTIMNLKDSLVNSIMEQLRDEDIQLIVSTGGGIDLSKIKEYPESWIVQQFVPQQLLMKEIDIFITHCGGNSVMDALVNGLPMLTLPQGADQFNNAVRVEELNMAIRLNQEDVNNGLVREKFLELVNNPVYKQVAQGFKQEYAKYDGPRQTAELIERLAKEKRPILRLKN